MIKRKNRNKIVHKKRIVTSSKPSKAKGKGVGSKRAGEVNKLDTASIKNRNAYWSVYENLQKKVDAAWVKLRSDVHKKASPEILKQGRDHLLLLLGECNYMAGECLRTGAKKK